MIKRLLRKILLELLHDDVEVKMEITKIANPDLAYEIKYGDRKNPPPKPPVWWKDPFI